MLRHDRTYDDLSHRELGILLVIIIVAFLLIFIGGIALEPLYLVQGY